MLERYLLSALASKFGHVFEDFDENTTAELSAWRGVLVLRNLHLRKDALRHLGGDKVGEEDNYDDEYFSEDDDILSDDDSTQFDEAEGDHSDDDSFQSCASQLEDIETQFDDLTIDIDNITTQNNKEEKRRHKSSTQPPKAKKNSNDGRVIEIVHGSIGSLEIHIPWRLLRAASQQMESDKPNTDNKSSSNDNAAADDGLRCSAVLSDVRILLAPSNHTRSMMTKGGEQSNEVEEENIRGVQEESQPLSAKERRKQKLERIRRERELAVQSLLEKELFKLVSGNGSKETSKTTVKDANIQKPGGSRLARLSSWAKGFVARALTSLKVTVQNIHIRYEDEGYGWFEDTTTVHEPLQHQRRRYRPAFSVGMRLDKFSIRNAEVGEEPPTVGIANASNSSEGISATVQLQHKVANVEQLSVYWDSSHQDLFVGYVAPSSSGNAHPFRIEDDRLYYEKRFDELDILSTDGAEGPLQHNYLIHPMSPSVHLVMTGPSDRDVSTTAQTTIQATLSLPSCSVRFDRNTLEDSAYIRKCSYTSKQAISSLQDRLMEERISHQLSILRPPPDVRPTGNARLWWKYAIAAVTVLHRNHNRLNQQSTSRGRRFKRKGWLGLARLLRLQKEYTSLYESLWNLPHRDTTNGRNEIHDKLVAMEDLLNDEEIVSFRMAIFSKLSESSTSGLTMEKSSDSATQPRDADVPITESLSLDVDELALGKLSVLSVEYREIKLNHIVSAFDSEQDQKTDMVPDSFDNEAVDSAVLTLSVACQNFNVQANDTINNEEATSYVGLRRLPIAQSNCSFSLVFHSFRNRSWDVSCELGSLTVTDLISSRIDGGSKDRVLIGMKQSDKTCQLSDIRAANIVIRNVRETSSQLHATAYIDINVSPVEVVYSTNAFEALSRLFAAVKTDEFSKDYERISQALSRWRRSQRKKLMAVLSRRKKFIVSIDIAAPVLMIPEDLQNMECPILVIDLGRFTIRSNDSSEVLPDGFDDKWLLQFTDIRAICTKEKTTSAGSIITHKHALIEPFSLNFSAMTHIAPASTADKSIIAVEALLPRLSFNLTTSAVRLVSRLQIRWKNAKSRNLQVKRRQTIEDILSSNGDGLQRRQRYQFDDIRNTSEEPLHSLPEIDIASEQEVKFSFSAPTIVLRIGNDLGFEHLPEKLTTSLIPLIDLSISGIGGEHISTTTHTGVSSVFTSRLRSIHLKDESCFSHVMSSIEPSLLNTINHDNLGEDADLVVVQVSKQSNGDSETVIRFHELYVEWNPETFARVQSSMRLPPAELAALTESVGTASFALDTDEDILNAASQDSEFFDAFDSDRIGRVESVSTTQKTLPNYKISFFLSKLQMNFNKDSQERCLFVAEMNQTQITYCRKPLGGAKTTATIADARLKDPGKTLYGQIIGLQSSSSKSIMQLSFESFPRDAVDSFDGERNYDNFMKIDFSEMKFVYIQQLWLEIFDYFFEGILGHAVWGTKPKTSPNVFDPLQMTKAFKRTRLSINMDQPLLLLPVTYRSPQHIRLKLSAFTAASHFTVANMKGADKRLSEWTQWFHNCRLELCGLDIQSWDDGQLNEVHNSQSQSLVVNIRWPVGPTAPLVKPKWNVVGTFDPLSMRLSRKDFSLFRFFVNYNLLEPSRFLSRDANEKLDNLVLFGYEKQGLPPTTYSVTLQSESLEFHFYLDEEESSSRKSEEVMCVKCTNARYTLLKNIDCISRQTANVESIHLAQTSDREEWSGFQDLLLPISLVPGQSRPRLLQFTSTTRPNGDNVKSLHLDQAGIYMIVPAWQHVGDFFKYLPTSPEIFAAEEMASLMQVGDRFYRMSKRLYRMSKTTTCDVQVQSTSGDAAQVATQAQEAAYPTESRQFLFSLTSPRIILVSDATGTADVNSCVTLHMANLHYHQSTHLNQSAQSVICHGMEIFAGQIGNPSSHSSLICPFSVCGSLSKSLPLKTRPQVLNGWIWMEELQAHAAYTDMVSSIDVLNGVNKQIMSNAQESKVNSDIQPTSDNKDRKNDALGQIIEAKFDVLCGGFSLVVTDDSHRHFANAQALIEFSLVGLRCSRVVTQSHDVKTFVTLDRLELTDLLQSEDSPFRIMVSSSNTASANGGFFSSFVGVVPALSWESHKMLVSDWGFQLSSSMETLREAIGYACAFDKFADHSSVQACDFVFRNLSHGNGISYIELSLSHLTAQWNPSTVIAFQRFLGRMKKFTTNILTTSAADKNVEIASSNSSKAPESADVIFSVKADIQSVSIYLNKEYQQRRILDTKVMGVGVQFERFHDNSRLLQGAISSLQVWDPDLSKDTSDRNRRILKIINDSGEEQSLLPVFSFQYRTFNGQESHMKGANMSLPRWVEERATAGDIDDFLSIKLSPIEFNYLRERSAELADYLNNGLPGKGMGATSKAAQSFCESRIKTRSFLDIVLERPRVFIPRSASSLMGGCYLSLGTVAITSWFEEALACNVSSSVGEEELQNTMDWYRVLDVKLGLGISVELFEPAKGLASPDTFFETKLTVMKPTIGKVTQVRGGIKTFNIRLSYRDFLMLRLIMRENVGKAIDETQWENIEKIFWQTEGTAADGSSHTDTGVLYAETARYVRFGEKVAAKDTETRIEFLLESMNITLHRDDWFDNLDEEHASYLCYDICKFSVQNFKAILIKRSAGSSSASLSLHDMSFTDLGDYGRLARDIYLGGNEQKRPPCAFSVVAEGYGESSQDPLLSLDVDTEGCTKTIDLKVNALSITLLPRSIEDVISFGSGKWHCPRLFGTNQSTDTVVPSKEDSDVTNSVGSIQFKFVAMYPRLLLLADETDPFSRALILRGMAVGNINRIHEEVSNSTKDFVDIQSTTTLTGHFKDVDTRIHQNVDELIGPSRKLPKANFLGVPLIEPVSITMEVRNVSRTRFPTTLYLSIDIDRFATLFTFSDVSLIEAVVKKWSKKRKAKAKTTKEKDIVNRRKASAFPTPNIAQTHSSQFSKSSDASVDSNQPVTFDVVILTRKIGLTLRKSSTSVTVDTSSNPSVQAGDVLVSIDGNPVGKLPLPYIVNLFESSPRPLSITLQRSEEHHQSHQQEGQHNQVIYGGISSGGVSSSTGLVGTLTTDTDATNEDFKEPNQGQDQAVTRIHRFDCTFICGVSSGLEIGTGLGDIAVVEESKSASADNVFATATSASSRDDRRMPLPGAMIVAIDGEEVTAEEVLHLISSYETSTNNSTEYVISFVEADSSVLGVVTKFDAKLSFKLTLVDDKDGRDMPVMRIGLDGTSLFAAHGLTVATKRINAKRPPLISYNPGENPASSSGVLTVESEISSMDVEYYNAIISQWEPLIEPHCIGASIERQGHLFSIKLGDQLYKQNMESTPVDFFSINISDSAIGILGRALKNWRQFKSEKEMISLNASGDLNATNQPALPKSKDGRELKKATKLAKLALELSRKRGKVVQSNLTENSPFVLRNQTGLCISFSGNGVATTSVGDGSETQFEMTPYHQEVDQSQSESRFTRYDGRFPALDIQLGFDGIAESHIVGTRLYAEKIEGLPTDKVGRTMQRVFFWEEGGVAVSTHIDLVWTVELEENRRILTLSSSTGINVYGCGPNIEVGVRLSKSGDSTNIHSVGCTQNGCMILPVWAEACFCSVAVFIRPVGASGASVHEWSSSPVLELLKNETSVDQDQEVSFASNTGAIEVHYKWVTKMDSLGGVECALGNNQYQSLHRPVWLQCTYTEERIENALDIVLDGFHRIGSCIKTVTVWPSISIRNMLPCGIEWEIASGIKECETKYTLDSTQLRQERNTAYGKESSMPGTYLQCGNATEIFATHAGESKLYGRFKCIIYGECSWSEWLEICIDGSKSNAKQINIQCKGPLNNSPLTLGVKLSDRAHTESGKGINLILYAEIWLRNLTSLPLAFGAPSSQIEPEGGIDSSLPAKVSAESALIELTSVLEGSSFGLLGGNDDDGDDGQCDDNLNLPLQQCETEVYEEVFEYVSLNDRGEIERKWWASENHIILRKEPDVDKDDWQVDCIGDPYLENGWESCANIAGSKLSAFGGRRVFDKRHRFRRRRWFRKETMQKQIDDTHSLSEKVIFHQPADLDQFTRAKREAERNAIGAQLDDKKDAATSGDGGGGGGLLDLFNLPLQREGILDIMTTVANDGSILISVKYKDGKWSTPVIIPPSGSANGAIRAVSTRWPLVTKAINERRRGNRVIATPGTSPTDPSVFELIYQVTTLSGLWGELSRMVTITPRFLVKNESSWLDIELKQVGAPDGSSLLLPKKTTLPFYWFDSTLPELVCTRPATLSGYKWSGGFDLCTLGMLPLRVRQSSESRRNAKLKSMRVSVELQPGTGGSGTIISMKDEDPDGEGSLFRIENHCPFQIFVSQDNILANPSLSGRNTSCDSINPGESTSYALDVPWRQGKYEGRTSASLFELLMVRCSLAPLSTREGVESTKVLSFSEVGQFIRLAPYKLATALGLPISSELLGVRVIGMVGSDGPTRCLRFVLTKTEVTTSSVIGNAVRETIKPMPSFMSSDSLNTQIETGKSRDSKFLASCAETSILYKTGKLLDEPEAARSAFFGTGVCARAVDCSNAAQTFVAMDEYSCELLFSGFVLSFIDSSPTELAVLSCHDLKIDATWDSQRKRYARSTIVVGWLQLDNHCPGAIYPVALCPRPRKVGYDGVEEKPFTAEKPFFELQLDFAPRHRTGIQCLSAGVALRDAFIFIDLAFIMRVQRFLLRIQDHMMDAMGKSYDFIDSQESWDPPNIEDLIKKMTSSTVEVGNKSIFLQRLAILPCKVKLSVAPAQALTKYQEAFEGSDAAAIHAAVRKGDLLFGEGSGLGVKIGGQNRTALAVMRGMLKSVLVDALIRCDGASLNFDGVALFNQLSNGQQLATYLGAHYVASLIANVPSLIGSLAAFGNPVGLMRGLGDGVSDFVKEPVKGFKKSIEEMDPTFAVSGVARGAGSLGRHTVGGIAGSAAMLTETAAKNMAVLTLDRKYAQKRDRLMKLKANGGKGVNIVRGFESGVQKLIQGILEGVKGVVSKPIRGAERSGFQGFAKGIGKGLLGLLVKPVIGTTDFLTDTLIGVKGAVEGTSSESYLNVHNQIRPRRALYGRDRVIRPYRIDDASAATIQARSCLGGEEYYAHVDMTNKVALMSVNHLLILSEDGKEMLRLSYQQMKKVEVRSQEDDESYLLVIYLNVSKRDGTDIEEVGCQDEELAKELRDKLMKAISATTSL